MIKWAAWSGSDGEGMNGEDRQMLGKKISPDWVVLVVGWHKRVDHVEGEEA